MMLKLNHGRTRRLAGLFLASAIAASGIATAGAAAQESPKPETKKFEKKIHIHHVGDRDVLKRGEPGELGKMDMCPGEVFKVESAGGSADRKEDVTFLICTDRGDKMLPALEKAEADLQTSNDMPADRKAELLTKIRAKIAELRARG